MAGDNKSGDNSDWDQVFSKGAYFIGGGFIVGCGLSVLTSSTWPVMFSTGVGLGLACVNLENEMWNKGKTSETFDKPWIRVREKSSEESRSEAPSSKDSGIDDGLESRGGWGDTPTPQWRQGKDHRHAVPLERDDQKIPEKDREKTDHLGKYSRDEDYEGKTPETKKDDSRNIMPCPKAPKKKAQKKEKERKKAEEPVQVESDPDLFVD